MNNEHVPEALAAYTSPVILPLSKPDLRQTEKKEKRDAANAMRPRTLKY